MCGKARVRTDLVQRIQDRLVVVFRAASVLLAGVDVITVRVNDVLIARADDCFFGLSPCWPVSILTRRQRWAAPLGASGCVCFSFGGA